MSQRFFQPRSVLRETIFANRRDANAETARRAVFVLVFSSQASNTRPTNVAANAATAVASFASDRASDAL